MSKNVGVSQSQLSAVNKTYKLSPSVLQVYLEQVRDLLAEGPQDRLEVKVGVGAGGSVPGLTQATVAGVEQAWEYLRRGQRARTSAATSMNDVSSRSHCLLCLRVRGRSKLTGVAPFRQHPLSLHVSSPTYLARKSLVCLEAGLEITRPTQTCRSMHTRACCHMHVHGLLSIHQQSKLGRNCSSWNHLPQPNC